MNNNMGDYRSRCYEDRIRISILSITTMPNCLNTSRIHCGVLGYGKILQITKYGTRFLTVIGKQSGKILCQNGSVG